MNEMGLRQQQYNKLTSDNSHIKTIHWYLIIVCVVQIFIIIILVLFHLVSDRPLPWRCMPVIHWIVGITSRADIRPCGETSCTKKEKLL